jgi:hypothetical protein
MAWAETIVVVARSAAHDVVHDPYRGIVNTARNRSIVDGGISGRKTHKVITDNLLVITVVIP